MSINTQKLRDLAGDLETYNVMSRYPQGLLDAADAIDAQTTEIARLRDEIEEAIRLLGMDRPIDPTDVLRAALSGESHD